MAFAPAVWFAVQEELYGSGREESTETYLDKFDDEYLFKRFHLTRPCISFITDCVRVRMMKNKTTLQKMNGHSVEATVIAALDFYANGILSETVLSKLRLDNLAVHDMINAVSSVLSGMVKEFITFPVSRGEIANVAHEIKNFSGIPNVVGVLGCMHVKVRPPVFDRDVFCNTMNDHTIMTQVVCDSEGNFLSVENCCVGSTPEQSVWDSSVVGRRVMQGTHGPNWVIGGRGYTLSQHLLTSVSPARREADRRFNQAHARVLASLQRTLTCLKRRFACLANLGHTQKNNLDKKAEVINACCVLYNIARKFSVAPVEGRVAGLSETKLETLQPGVQYRGTRVEVPKEVEKARDDFIINHFSGLGSGQGTRDCLSKDGEEEEEEEEDARKAT